MGILSGEATLVLSFLPPISPRSKLFPLRVDPFWKSFSVQGPVVQSIVSLTSSLSGQLVKCFMTL